MSRRRKRASLPTGCPHCGAEGLGTETGRPRVGRPVQICPACRGIRV